MCSVDGCDRTVHCKKLCATHYNYSRQGLELKPLRPQKSPVYDWTAEKVLAESVEDGDCRLFRPERKAPYGRLLMGETTTSAHRLVFEHFYGPVEPDAQIHHICGKTKCVNPTHLQRTSQAANVGEMLARRDYEAKIAHLEAKVAALEAQLEKEWELV